MGVKSLLLNTVDALNLYPIFNRYTKDTATIFMLHSITPSGIHRDGAISTDEMASHFEYLKRKRYNVLSLRDYINSLINHENTYKTVVFTVDDGYRDFYLNAFDAFKRFDFPATVFITSDFIERRLFFWWDMIEFSFQNTCNENIDLVSIGMGTADISTPQEKADIAQKITRYCKKLPNNEKLSLISDLVEKLQVDISDQPRGIYEPLSWDEIREMANHRIDFLPHTKTHPILSRIPPGEQEVELTEPKRIIEERLAKKADIFCYPNGQGDDFTEETITILKSAGYIAAVMGVPGFDNTQKDTDLFRLKRFGIPTEKPLFKQYVSGLERFKETLLK